MTQKQASNGNALSGADLNGQTIEFPVTFQLKAVMAGIDRDDEHKANLEEVFTKLKIEHKYLNRKVSSKGTYVSFTYEVIILDRRQLDKLYENLKSIKDLKFAV